MHSRRLVGYLSIRLLSKRRVGNNYKQIKIQTYLHVYIIKTLLGLGCKFGRMDSSCITSYTKDVITVLKYFNYIVPNKRLCFSKVFKHLFYYNSTCHTSFLLILEISSGQAKAWQIPRSSFDFFKMNPLNQIILNNNEIILLFTNVKKIYSNEL